MILKDRVALVTGASRGIGRAIAVRLAREGASVACAATTADGCAATVEEAGPNAFALKVDVSSAEDAQAGIDAAIERFGKLDILINNAGIARDALLMRMSDEDWSRVLDVNLKGAFHCIKAASRNMMKARYGRIINITSIVGLSGQAGQTNYAAAKAGLIGLTKSVAKELGPRGITCNAIAPGFIETDMTSNLPQEMREHVEKASPLGRLGAAEDVAGAALFLASDDSAYITGQVLVVDGGLTL